MTPPKTLKERQREEVRPVVLALLEKVTRHDLTAALLGQSGPLQRSLHAEHDRNAAIHQFGAKKDQPASKKDRLIPWGDLPARPLLGVRDPERKQSHNAIPNHLRSRN